MRLASETAGITGIWILPEKRGSCQSHRFSWLFSDFDTNFLKMRLFTPWMRGGVVKIRGFHNCLRASIMIYLSFVGVVTEDLPGSEPS